jgi:D-alanyl-D-alanine carboxypeptidase (penicillin-binding protein 5/6)
MLRLILLALAALPMLAAAEAPKPPSVVGRAWMVQDLASGQVLTQEKPDERFEPASLTKLMTAYLVYAALRDKKLSLDGRVSVSQRAWRAPGSRMFIDPRLRVGVEDLVLGMVVQSGNDASIALAEAVAGSEDAFVQQMGREAERLGMKNTKFMNATGLPDPQHYSTARDLALLATALIRDFPEQYAKYYSQREFRYNNITQQNRNRLLWLDPTVDGVKTGFTEAAGYCLIASSKRGPRRLLSVLLGSSSESTRAQESQKLLNWGFQSFDAVRLYDKGQAVKEIEVWKGARAQLKAGFRGELVVTIPKGEAAKLKAELLAHSPLVAPVAEGQRVGVLRVTLEGKPLGEFPVVALESIAAAGIFGRAWDTLRLWLK